MIISTWLYTFAYVVEKVQSSTDSQSFHFLFQQTTEHMFLTSSTNMYIFIL